MEQIELITNVEALIFASERPIPTLELVEIMNNTFGFMDFQITLPDIENTLECLQEKYNAPEFAFAPIQTGGGWQFLTKAAFHKIISQLNADKFIKKLSGAALETLSIIAYKQPITKGEIESIRGVNSDYSVQKLLDKDLIVISGREEKSPGKPLLYATSKSFMDYFGINSPNELPKLKEVISEEAQEATKMNSNADTSGPTSALTYD